MKLQGMSIIFALIIVPIILVLSYYISLQVDTIKVQGEYDLKLLDSTHDAMAAFELNTANESLSTVSDSLRTIIEASYNVFISNLSTNLGMSNANKSYVEPFIPAVLYTLYDGYYICAPTKVPTVLIDSNGNAVAVGDPGVSKSGSDYVYTEPVDGTPTTLLTGDETGLDYAQLLYLKKGSTNVYTTDISNAELQIKNVLKTYMPYSARYVGTNFDLKMVYTLDNFMTVEGKIGNVYYTKSGYLIPNGSVEIKIESPLNGYGTNIDDYNQNDIQYIIENRMAKFTVIVKDAADTVPDTSYVLSPDTGRKKSDLESKMNILDNALRNSQELLASNNNNSSVDKYLEIFTNEYFDFLKSNGINNLSTGNWDAEKNYTESLRNAVPENKKYLDESKQKIAEILKNVISSVDEVTRNTEYELNLISSVVYYSKAYIFSKWVNDYLCNSATEGGCEVKENNLVEVAGQKYTTIKGIESLEFDFSSDAQVFNLVGTLPVSVTEIPNDCPFYQHKLNVIKMSIQYNLNLAMSTYNNNKSYVFEYEMPVIKASEWEQILSHISITSFMQGVKCGLKTYNNYKIVSSTNNDILITPNEIFYVNKSEFNNETSEYHRINCSKLLGADDGLKEYIAFGSKEVKYDKISNKNRDFMVYEYDHKNFACYDCINDRNYFNYRTDSDTTYDINNPSATSGIRFDAKVNIFDKTKTKYGDYVNLRKAYYIGVGKERNDTYKMNAFQDSQGYEILQCNKPDLAPDVVSESSLSMDKIKAIEISIGTIVSENDSIRNAIYRFGYGAEADLSNDTYSIATNNTSNNSTQSVRINIIPGKNVGASKFNISSLVIGCENADDILKPVSPDSKENAIVQFRKTIKYVRVIYK